MESIHNVPSIEQISFKLTQNAIPSIANLSPSFNHDDSLDYTISRVSIQQLLHQDQNPSTLPPQIDPLGFWKGSSLKTTCAATTAPSSIKKITKTTFRKRIISSNKSGQKTSFRRRLSHHVMNMAQQFKSTKNELLPLHSPHPAPYRTKQNRSRCSSGGRILGHEKVKSSQLYQLECSLKVKPLPLQTDSTRQKKYMKGVMQKRGSMMHPVEEISSYTPVLTHRRGFRIH